MKKSCLLYELSETRVISTTFETQSAKMSSSSSTPSPSKVATFREKVASLEQQVKKFEGEKCIPTMAIAAAVIPLLIFLVLFFLQPGFVQRTEGNKSVRSVQKVFIYTLVISLIAWALMYCYSFFTGSAVCARP